MKRIVIMMYAILLFAGAGGTHKNNSGKYYTPSGEYYSYFEDEKIFGEFGDFYAIQIEDERTGWRFRVPRSQLEVAYNVLQGEEAMKYEYEVTEYEADGETETGWKVYAGAWSECIELSEFEVTETVQYEVNGWNVQRYYLTDEHNVLHIVDCISDEPYQFFIGVTGAPTRHEGFTTEEVLDIIMEGLHIRR